MPGVPATERLALVGSYLYQVPAGLPDSERFAFYPSRLVAGDAEERAASSRARGWPWA